MTRSTQSGKYFQADIPFPSKLSGTPTTNEIDDQCTLAFAFTDAFKMLEGDNDIRPKVGT